MSNSNQPDSAQFTASYSPPWAGMTGRCASVSHMPFPAKLLAVGVGFLIFKPLGLALLIYFLWNARRHGPSQPGWRPRGSRGFGAGNSAMQERRRETLTRLDEEAKEFAAFAETQRRNRDKEAFDRFMAERGEGEQKL